MNSLSFIREYLSIQKKHREYRKYVVPFIEKNKGNVSEPDLSRTISVFSNPRGGSTWLSDLFSTLPDSTVIWEPMNIQSPYPELQHVSFCWNQFIPEEENWPEAEQFFKKLYGKKIEAFRLYAVNKKVKRIPAANYFIFKFVGANMFIPWLTKRMNIRPVYMVRHPCAVIASQLRYRHLFDDVIKNPRNSFPRGRYNDELLELYKDIFDKVNTPEERLAAEWAITNVIPIANPANDLRWITVSYERLYKCPEVEINRMFGRLKIAPPEDIYSLVRKASSTAINKSSGSISSGKQLDSWRNQLSSRQISSILSITKEFGADFYDDSSDPDYSRIYRC